MLETQCLWKRAKGCAPQKHGPVLGIAVTKTVGLAYGGMPSLAPGWRLLESQALGRSCPCLRIRQVPAGRPGGEMKIANRRCDGHVLSTPVVKVDPMNIMDGGMEAGGCAEPRAAS
jgi:hypothetical protein